MSLSRTKRIALTSAAALGIAAGAAGIAGAATGGSGGETGAENDHEAQFTSSITVDDTQEAASEEAESAALADVATVSVAEAKDAALAAVPGDAAEAELENEDGNVVYSVEVTAADGTVTDVKVDAGNGSILAQDHETNDGPEGTEGNEGAEND